MISELPGRPAPRAAILLIALFLLATFAPLRLHRAAPVVATAIISFEPLALDGDDPRRKRAGKLVYLGGWQLRSDNPRFGGISAMHIDAGQAIALSDAGTLIRFHLPRTSAHVRGSIDVLPDGPGSASIKRDRDSEALTVFGNRAWVGFERQNAVWRYRTSDWRSDARAAPDAMRKWPKNMGSEGIVRLRDGRFLLFAEAPDEKGESSEVLLFDGDPALAATRARSLRYRVPRGYRLTDAGLLPDGKLLLLNRRFALFEGVSAKLLVADPGRIEKEGEIRGQIIAELRSPLLVDNMEALSIGAENGRTIVWIASDDNFNPMQRTLLLKFALAD